MPRIANALAIVTGLALAIPVEGGQFNKKLNIGDAAPSWSALPGVDDKRHSLADLKDKDLVVVVFTCNSCPVAVAYEDRIIEFTRKFGGPESKVAVVAICVNDRADDRLPQMKDRAKSKGFAFPYLYDKSQQIGRAYGATITPEFFVLNKERKVAYMGAMDDKVNSPTISYLEQAVKAILKGEKPATDETLAKGCSVKYAKKR
jgi:peroxiredoxin